MSVQSEAWDSGYHCRDQQVADLERQIARAQAALKAQHEANGALQAERDALLNLLDEGRRLDAIGRHPKTHPESWRELKRDYDNRRDAALAAKGEGK